MKTFCRHYPATNGGWKSAWFVETDHGRIVGPFPSPVDAEDAQKLIFGEVRDAVSESLAKQKGAQTPE
jgi:hypothetical protein